VTVHAPVRFAHAVCWSIAAAAVGSLPSGSVTLCDVVIVMSVPVLALAFPAALRRVAASCVGVLAAMRLAGTESVVETT
jgi:hypothetical protein